MYNKLLNNHTLIAGATGSGKSILLKNILYNFNLKNIEYNIIDLKKVSLIDFKKSTQFYATTTEQAHKLIRLYLDLMYKRYKKMEHLNIDKSRNKPIYLIIDELADLLDSSKLVHNDLIKLLRLGRAAGVFVVVASQDPSRKTLSHKLIQNLNNRVALRCNSMIEYRQILGVTVEPLKALYGYCYILTPADMQPIKYKIEMLTDEQIKQAQPLPPITQLIHKLKRAIIM